MGSVFKIALNSKPKFQLTAYDGTALSKELETLPHTLLGGMTKPKSIPVAKGSYGTFFGTGTTPAMVDDIKMQSPIDDSTLSFSNASAITASVGPDHMRMSINYDVTNNGTNDVAISEIGVFGTLVSSDPPFMLDHTVLETPIIIPAGDTKPIAYAVIINYPAT